MPIVFEEVIGEVEPTRGSQPADNHAAGNHGTSLMELCELMEQQARLHAERCQRSHAD